MVSADPSCFCSGPPPFLLSGITPTFSQNKEKLRLIENTTHTWIFFGNTLRCTCKKSWYWCLAMGLYLFNGFAPLCGCYSFPRDRTNDTCWSFTTICGRMGSKHLKRRYLVLVFGSSDSFPSLNLRKEGHKWPHDVAFSCAADNTTSNEIAHICWHK